MNNEIGKTVHSICEVNIDGKMSLVSLYDDLPHFEYDETIDKLKESNIKCQNIIKELKDKIKNLEDEKLHMKTINSILSKNITSLYKTACSEIRRKDNMISELRIRSPVISHTLPNFYQKSVTQSHVCNSSEKTDKSKIEIETPKVFKENKDLCSNSVTIIPNKDIPKTIYYKRLCQKLIQNNTKDTLKNVASQNSTLVEKIDNNYNIKKPHMIQEDDLITTNTNITLEEFSMSTDASKANPNSTLVICESDVTHSDGEINTSVVSSSFTSENGKQNTSESFFSKLKQPIRSKNKIVITPATIGVKNSCETIKYDEKDQLPLETLKNTNTELNILKNDKHLYDTYRNSSIDDKSITNRNFTSPSKTNISEISNTPNLVENQIPSINIEVEQVPIFRKRTVRVKNVFSPGSIKSESTLITPDSSQSVVHKTSNMKYLSVVNDSNSDLSDSSLKNSAARKKYTIENKLNKEKLHGDLKITKLLQYSVNKLSTSNDVIDLKKISEPSINIEVEQGRNFKRFKRKVIVCHNNNNLNEKNQDIKKGRRVKLITIQDHCSKTLTSFNGAKKTEIDVSKNLVQSGKVVESSSHFYVPQLKRKRTICFGNADM
ncbi:uncharacterized protein LOC126896909 [Daktulosphaira vitifoliae]|uniref:uncharacterized protein LOC126896909 n=1 Tax=Daktulosphaira vitifoliae TaxID=58002 RepID=UPI0021AAC327|nr:uncharacterized protein LOC126896909 [Daktulosphaira vitifoliae]